MKFYNIPKLKFFSTLIIFSLLAGITISEISNAQKKNLDDNPAVKPSMHKIFDNLKELLPVVVNEDKFNDPKNNSFISKKLKDIAKAAKETDHSFKSSTYKISADVLQSHFAEIERVYRLGNKSYARWQLQSTVPLCMSCHTQMPSESRRWDLADLTKGNLNDFDKAELFFMGRDFNNALKFYDSAIQNFPKNKISVNQLEKSFERKLVIFSRVNRDFDAGIENLETNLKNKEIPEFLNKNVKAWIALFRIQKREGFPNPQKRDDKAIQKYAEKELKSDLWEDMVDATNPKLVRILTVSGVLYEYLNRFPETPLKPDILNWLAQCDRHLQETLFFSLSDLYLKECMSEFPKHPTAKKCFQNFKDNLIFQYSGSSGVNIPDDVKKDLKDWSMKVFGEDKSSIEEDEE